MLALIVALLDWQQVSREEPWRLTKLYEDYWILERVHRRKATITNAFDFHGTGVAFVNDAGMPRPVFRRGTREVLQISPSTPGTQLTLNYRRLRFWERPGISSFNASGSLVPGKGEKTWSTPVY